MEATILLARRPPEASETWLPRSLVALAQRFGDARVRLLVADADAQGAAGVRAAPPPASFDVVVLIERARSRWTTGPARTGEPDDALRWLAGAHGHRAAARELLARPSPLRAGERSPGLVFVGTTVRAPQISPAEFDAHWRDRHAPLALRHHAGMSGYEQFVSQGALTARATPLDGLALLHFPSRAAFAERFYDSDAGRAAIAEDVQRFLDVPHCEGALMSEYGVRA